jgi:hypothetical protein
MTFETCCLCGAKRPVLEMAKVYEGPVRHHLCHPATSDDEQTCYIMWSVFGHRPGRASRAASSRQRA